MTKIVLTGAPSSGKSSILERVRALALPGVALLPEAARVLISMGYPIPSHEDAQQIHAFQDAVLKLQAGFEDSVACADSQIHTAVLDRGRIDGAGFWPRGAEDYFRTFQMNKTELMKLYDVVLFLEMPKKEYFGQNDPARFHDYEQSAEAGRWLEEIWSQHPRFIKISEHADFEVKVQNTLKLIQEMVKKKTV